VEENKVLVAAEKIMSFDLDNCKNLLAANDLYIEALTGSPAEDIEVMLRTMFDKYYSEFPFWARLIAFRLLCLLEPENDSFKKWAQGDVSAFGGPWWDNKVKW